jgi:hypothetical protein
MACCYSCIALVRHQYRHQASVACCGLLFGVSKRNKKSGKSGLPFDSQ